MLLLYCGKEAIDHSAKLSKSIIQCLVKIFIN